jgi:hypothetical protein
MDPIIGIAIVILLIHLPTLKIFCGQRKKEHPLMDQQARTMFTLWAVGSAILILYDLGMSMTGLLVASALPVIVGHIVGMNGMRENSCHY